MSFKLKPIIKRLKERPRSKLYITGYADIVGDEYYNQKLSERRAVAVYNSMRDNLLDVSDSRIIIKGKGIADPVDSNSTEEGRSRNRRVEVVSPSIDIKN
nr:OmpA family protein [Photobacterium damselae]